MTARILRNNLFWGGVIFGLCFIFGLAYMSSGNARGDDKILDIQIVESDSGLKAWLVSDESLPLISVKFAFRGAGSALDPVEKQGLARFVSTMLDEGAGDHDSQAFQKILTDQSITLNFSAGRDNFSGTLKTLSRHEDLAFDLLRLALTEPRFDAEPMERMRASMKSRIRSSITDPQWVAARLLNDAAFDGHPYARNSGGTLTTLDNITADDLARFHQTHLTRDKLVIAIAGDVTASEAALVLDEVFATLPAGGEDVDVADLTVQNAGKTILYEKDIPQTVIRMAQPGIYRDDPDYYTALVMNHILGAGGFGSRLMEEVREKRGLTYGIYSSLYDMRHVAVLQTSSSTQNESVADLINVVKDEYARMQSEPVTTEELESAQAYLVGSLPLKLTSTDRIAGVMRSMQLDDLPPDYLDRRAGKINAVTAADIQSLAQELLRPEAQTTILVGQPETVTPDIVVDSLPNVE